MFISCSNISPSKNFSIPFFLKLYTLHLSQHSVDLLLTWFLPLKIKELDTLRAYLISFLISLQSQIKNFTDLDLCLVNLSHHVMKRPKFHQVSTLMQKTVETGKVHSINSQEMIVKTQPQNPTPASYDSAETEIFEKKCRGGQVRLQDTIKLSSLLRDHFSSRRNLSSRPATN